MLVETFQFEKDEFCECEGCGECLEIEIELEEGITIQVCNRGEGVEGRYYEFVNGETLTICHLCDDEPLMN